MYPRNLTGKEKDLLNLILPENKPGYKVYRDKINFSVVVGEGRFGEGNYFLGKSGTFPDLSFPSTPVFALGTVYVTNAVNIDIIIHEEDDNLIEVEFGVDINENHPFYDEISSNMVIKVNSYSRWVPGMKSPFSDTEVKIVGIKPEEYLLAISGEEKKIWLHSKYSGVNHLIPVTNYYNSLMLFRNERNTEKVLNPNLFFDNLGTFNDNELASAFIIYNQYMRRKLL